MTEGTSRRKPVQARSKRRYEAILDAAAAEFAAQGFENTTVEAIAARADTSIGSVYQFFANKRELFVAIGERCVERTRTLYEAVVQPEALGGSWVEFLEGAVDAFIQMARSDPDLKAVNANLHLYGLIEEIDIALMRELSDGAAAALGFFAPELPEVRRAAAGKTIVQTINAFLFFSSRVTEAEANETLVEMKRMLRAYLETLVGP